MLLVKGFLKGLYLFFQKEKHLFGIWLLLCQKGFQIIQFGDYFSTKRRNIVHVFKFG